MPRLGAPNIPIADLSPEERAKRRAYFKEYRRKHKDKIKRNRHRSYQLSGKRDKQDRQLRYKYDPEWREKVKEYNRERHRLIKEGKWKPTRGKNYEQNKSSQVPGEGD